MLPADDISAAVDVLRRGGLVAFPTETVYGLGADAANPEAVDRIFVAKGRPRSHPIIVHLAEPAAAKEWAAEVPDSAAALADAFWPGPLTLVLPRSDLVPDAVTGGLDTVGLRVPAQPLALELLRAFGGGVAAPSANRFGRVSPTRADHVRTDLGSAVDLILDGGPCPVGVESTIVDCSGLHPRLLRPGGLPVESLEAVLGYNLDVIVDGSVRAPGMLASHYAPTARVEVLAPEAVPARAEALVALGLRVGILAPGRMIGLPAGIEALPPTGGAVAYAQCLYQRLREADRRGVEVLLAVPPPEIGVGTAVADRLRRAAAAGSTD
ncbi:MAG TPA: L-threonylcarbamoyladenylate synthase [Acidimicrobiia bacterium]|jgi:L-threonylcarbamoyladenylate synthase